MKTNRYLGTFSLAAAFAALIFLTLPLQGGEESAWGKAVDKYDAREDAMPLIMASKPIEKGKNYSLSGAILQVGGDYISVTAIENKPYAFVVVNPEKMKEVPVKEGDRAEIIGTFSGYHAIPMADGTSQNMPVFAAFVVGAGNAAYEILSEEQQAKILEAMAAAKKAAGKN